MVRTYEFGPGQAPRSFESPSLADASAALPGGVYTSLRTYRGTRVLRLRQHVSRLLESLALQGRPAALAEAEVREALATAIRDRGHEESRIRITFAPPRLFVSVEPFRPLPASLYAEGVSCVTLSVVRDNPHAKDTRFLATAGEAYAGLPAGVHEGLLLSEAGEILEGLSSNFFGLAEGSLRTEAARILEGVTRAQVLELAEALVPVTLRAVRVGETAALQEAFLTSASRGVLPVVRIDRATVGSGTPGPLTLELIRRFAALAEREGEELVGGRG